MSGRALAIALALMSAPFAASADAPPRSAPPVAAYCCEQAPAVWTGLYIGTHIGGTGIEPSWGFPFVEAFNTFANQSFFASASGLLWGGHLGFNYQIHHFLIGAEVSYAGSWLSDASVTGPFPAAPFDRFVIDTADLLTVTGRLGFVHGQFLLYGKGGYASSLVEVKAGNLLGTTAQASRREGGWTLLR